MDLHKQSAPTPATELRASDAERDRTAGILGEALAEGRLTPDEHAERVDGALYAKTVGELEDLIRDLPAAPARTASAPGPEPGGIPAAADAGVVAVFSSAVRRGRLRAGRRLRAYAVFGSVEIDLSEAIFEYQQVVIKAVSVFGDVRIRVPENISLHGTGGGVLGRFEVSPLDSADPAAPVVHVDGWAVLGAVEARPRRGRTVSDILRRVQDKADRKPRRHPGR
ncbi:DUF1707 SHOCT-like domain-containing protein [Streptomyces nogalater]|uniref:DUF1707 domain-containing protein n=1 Tax=Streptomyces nogalater TaxID=38314 RepID=A0ABW0WBB2_STRNO